MRISVCRLMKIKIQKPKPTLRKIEIELDKEETRKEWKDIYRQLSQEVRIPGFRPGNIPQDILEKRFKDQARRKFIEKVIPQKYEQVLKENGLLPLSEVKVKDIQLEEEHFSFSLSFEVKPEFEVKDYRNIPLKTRILEVKKEEIDKIIDNLKKGFKEIQKIELSEDQGEKMFLKSLGCLDSQELRRFVESQIFSTKFNNRLVELRSQIMDYLVNKNDVEVPHTLLEESCRKAVEEQIADLKSRNVADSDISKVRKDLEERTRFIMENNIKFHLILEAIARKENIDTQGKSLEDAVLPLLLSWADISYR